MSEAARGAANEVTEWSFLHHRLHEPRRMGAELAHKLVARRAE